MASFSPIGRQFHSQTPTEETGTCCFVNSSTSLSHCLVISGHDARWAELPGFAVISWIPRGLCLSAYGGSREAKSGHGSCRS